MELQCHRTKGRRDPRPSRSWPRQKLLPWMREGAIYRVSGLGSRLLSSCSVVTIMGLQRACPLPFRSKQCTAPPPAPETWKCSVCHHVYDPAKDDPAKKNTPFEQLPATWKCPVCGAPKSAYKKSADGVWYHEEEEAPESQIPMRKGQQYIL